MSDEDKELEMLKAKRLAEMQKNLSIQDQLDENKSEENEKPKLSLRDHVVNSLGYRGMEVLQNAEYQFPNESKIIIEKLGELISSGDINETLDGGKLLVLFRSVGLSIRMENKINVEKDGKLWVITLNRPERMNALHSPAHFELEEIFNEFSTDPDAWVAIITGSGERAFCAGNDLRYQAEGGKLERNPMGFAGLTSRFDLKKPIIAAVNGVAMGGGFEIALACDLIIASENARFALPEPKVGLAALAGGMHRLPRQIGMKRAMGMMLTGRTVEAQEGLSLGFVNEVVAHQDLMESAKKWAESIMECSPTSVRTTKDVAMSGLSHASVETAMEQKYDSVVDLFKGEDFVEGPLAFSEKRKPNWTGK